MQHQITSGEEADVSDALEFPPRLLWELEQTRRSHVSPR